MALVRFTLKSGVLAVLFAVLTVAFAVAHAYVGSDKFLDVDKIGLFLGACGAFAGVIGAVVTGLGLKNNTRVGRFGRAARKTAAFLVLGLVAMFVGVVAVAGPVWCVPVAAGVVTGAAVLWGVDSWLTGFRYAGVLFVSTVVVVGSYLAGGVTVTDIEYAADRNIAIAMYQDQLDVAREYTDSGKLLYTFESEDPSYYSLSLLPTGHDRWAGVRDTSGPVDMLFFQSPRTEKNQQTGEPYDDNRGTCSKEDTATEPAPESALPDDVPVVPSVLTCVPVPGHEAKVIVEERDGGNGIVLLRILENVDADHFFAVHVILDPGTAPSDPAAYAKGVLDAVVVYDPDRVTAQELFDDAVAEL